MKRAIRASLCGRLIKLKEKIVLRLTIRVPKVSVGCLGDFWLSYSDWINAVASHIEFLVQLLQISEMENCT
jgi:hypothetical protein